MSSNRKPTLEPKVYTIAEVAALLKVNLPAAYEVAKSENFPLVQVGKRLLVPRAGFDRWLETEAPGNRYDSYVTARQK